MVEQKFIKDIQHCPSPLEKDKRMRLPISEQNAEECDATKLIVALQPGS